jgi:hypothetical protein
MAIFLNFRGIWPNSAKMTNTEQDFVHVNPGVLSGVGHWSTD